MNGLYELQPDKLEQDRNNLVTLQPVFTLYVAIFCVKLLINSYRDKVSDTGWNCRSISCLW